MQRDSRPPLLLIPGLSGSGDALAAAATRVFPGFDLIPSFHSIQSPTDRVDDLAERAAALLPAEGSAFVCGESFGGTIALALTRRYPERVRGLILLSTFAHLPRAATAHAQAMVALWANVVRRAPLLAYGARIAGMPGQFGRRVPLDAAWSYLREPLAEGPDYRHKLRLIAAFDARPWLDELRRPSIVVLGPPPTGQHPRRARLRPSRIPRRARSNPRRRRALGPRDRRMNTFKSPLAPTGGESGCEGAEA
jgi:pimeloyl-ACP methyl ester carboxylesterase